MPIYHQLGTIPKKRHTTFRKKDGTLHHEELFGTIGFDGMSSLLYHLRRPTMVKQVNVAIDFRPKVSVSQNIISRKLTGFDISPENDFLEARKPLMVNQDIVIGMMAPTGSLKDYFYKNTDADELLFIHKGSGILQTFLGNIAFGKGDYLLVPRGVIYQIHFDNTDNKILYLESSLPIYTPKRYRNWFGQLLEHSPYCERDYKLPTDLQTVDKKGEFMIKIQKQGMVHEVVYASHPFDVVGWDGYNYPYGFSIYDFEPITGRVHQPPPVHQTFETKNFVVCSFCPRLFDYHPEAIPAPYNHSNIDSDEVLYYVDGDFMSRKGIGPGYFTLHPSGIPHGPHPGTYEASIGKKETKEFAVMIDTFRPLGLTDYALKIENKDYHRSWLDEKL